MKVSSGVFKIIALAISGLALTSSVRADDLPQSGDEKVIAVVDSVVVTGTHVVVWGGNTSVGIPGQGNAASPQTSTLVDQCLKLALIAKSTGAKFVVYGTSGSFANEEVVNSCEIR